MAGRNQRDNADYFSHDSDASSDEKIVYIESKFGLVGYAVFFKLLECMTRTPGFKIQWDEIKKTIYAAKFHISVTEIEQIVTECCRQEIKAFILDDGFLFSPGLIKRFEPLIQKREYNRQKYQEQKQDDKKQLTEKLNSVTEITQSKVKESKEKNKNIYTSDFEKFWAEYPNRKCGKTNTFKSWKRLNGDKPEIDTLLKILDTHKKSTDWQKNNGQFIPMATTWLNQRRWDAEVENPEQKTKWAY